jgi:hypothetical protein
MGLLYTTSTSDAFWVSMINRLIIISPKSLNTHLALET